MNKVLFIGDLYRPGQSENILKTSALFSSLFKELEVTYDLFLSKTNYKEPCASEIAFWEKSLIGDHFDSYLTKYDLENTVVTGFEISEVDKRYLSQAGIDWISLSIHPLRFMDDLYFSVENSMNLDLSRSTVKKGFIDLSANVLIQRYNTRLINTKDIKSLCIIDQCSYDKSLFINNEFKSLKKYEEKIDKIVKNYDEIFYRRHPYKKNDKICNYFITRYDAQILEEPDIYKIFCEKSITSFCGISSSLLYEAESFGLKSIFLDINPLEFSEPVNYCSLIEDEKFWLKALKLKKNPKLTNFSKAIPKNYLRRIYGKWSYQSEEELFFNEINNYQKSKLDHEVYLINEKFHQSALDFSAKQAKSNSLIDSIEDKLVQFDSDTSNLRIALGQFKERVESELKSNSTTINDSSKISKNALELSINAQNVSLKAVQSSDDALELSTKAKKESTKALGNSDHAVDLSGRAIMESKNANAISTEAYDLSVKAVDESSKSKTLIENIAIDVKNIKKENDYSKKIAKKALDASKDASDRSLESKSMSIEALETSKRGIEEISKANVILKQTQMLVSEARTLQAEALSKLEVCSSELKRIKTKKLWKIFKVIFYLENLIERKITNYNSYKAFRNLRVPWHKHLYRTFAVFYYKSDKKWHTHLYRCVLSICGSSKYSPFYPTSTHNNSSENIIGNDKKTKCQGNGLKVLQFTNYKIEDYNQGGKIRCYEIRKSLRESGYDVKTLSFVLGTRDTVSDFHVEINESSLFKEIKDGTIADWAICNYIFRNNVIWLNIRKCVKKFCPDIILLEQPFLWPLVNKLFVSGSLDHRCLFVNSTHNIEFKLKENIYNSVFNSKLALQYTSEVRSIEEDVTKHADMTFCVSRDDYNYFTGLNENNQTFIFPNGTRIFTDYDAGIWDKRFHGTKNNWVFVASWHQPNIDGILRLIKAGINLCDPKQIKLWIFGSVVHPISQFLENQSKKNSVIQLIGESSDSEISSAIQGSTGVILPIWDGGGSNLKTAQALTSGKYIISTGFAFRGYENFISTDGLNIIDDEVEFINQMVSDLYPEKFIHRTNIENLEWDNILKDLPNILKDQFFKKNLKRRIGKIYFEVTSVHHQTGALTGITRVVSKLLYNFRLYTNDITFVVFDNKLKKFVEFDFISKNIINSHFSFDDNSTFLSFCNTWEYENYDLGLAEISLKCAKIIYFIHDVIPYKLPYSFGPGLTEKYIKWITLILKSGTQFLTNSELSKRDILEFCNEHNLGQNQKIDVIRLGDCIGQNNFTDELKNREPFILSVGTIEFRKNHQVLLDAYRILLQDKSISFPQLIIAGKQGWMDNHIIHQIKHDKLLKNNVIVLNNLSDEKLNELYENCLFTLYPSLYEGWGLPVAESFAHGKVCIISKDSSMSEICPDTTIEIDPLDPYKWSKEIKELVVNNSKLDTLEKLLLEKYNRQNWSNTTVDIISKIV